MQQVWSVQIEPALGGRVSSLRDPSGREWLWRNPDPHAHAGRALVRPGDPFVDAGGWEECFPTIAGASDHGEVWDRPWTPEGDALAVAGDGYALRRVIEGDASRRTARYRLEAAPGFRFIWAAHLLLDLSEDARLVAAAGTRCRAWPDHWLTEEPRPVEGPWPAPWGERLDGLKTDGRALFFMLLDPESVAVEDGGALRVRLDAPGQPTAVAVWRNLGGWPPEAPYRSIGIEPAIGRHYDRDRAAAGDLGVVGEEGVMEWTLTLDGG